MQTVDIAQAFAALGHRVAIRRRDVSEADRAPAESSAVLAGRGADIVLQHSA